MSRLDTLKTPALRVATFGALLSLLVAPSLVVAQDASSSPPAVDCDKPIKIGVLVPYTGSLNADAQEVWNAATLAVDDVNAAGGVNCRKLEAVLADTVDQRPDQVQSAANQLFADPDINLVMTAYASQTNFELDLMADQQMPYLISGNATQTRDIVTKDPAKYSTVWSMVPSYDAYNTEFPKLIDQWLREIDGFDMEAPSAFLIASDNPYSVGIADGMAATFEGLGWRIAGRETVPFGTVSDWGGVLAKVRADPPTVVINTDYQPSNDATFISQFRQNPTNSVVFIQYGPINAEFCELAGDDGTGVLYQSLGGPIQGGTSESAKLVDQIKEKYEAKYGEGSTGYFYAVGYWDVMLYAEAIKAVGDPSDRAGIAKWFSDLDTITPSGRLVYDQATHLATYGDDYLPLQIWQIGPDCARPLIYPANLTDDSFQLPPWMTVQ